MIGQRERQTLLPPPEPPAVPQATQRLGTALEGLSNALSAVFMAGAERLATAISLDRQHDADRQQSRRYVGRIVARNCPICSPDARVALAYDERANARDRQRDEHVEIVAQLMAAGKRFAQRIAARIELALTGRSRTEVTRTT